MSDEQSVNPARRGFLKALVVTGGAGAVAAVAPGAALANPQAPTPAPAGRATGYRETEHVRAYYASARI